MTTSTLTPADFLLARIAEDEYLARSAQGSMWPELVDALVMYVNIGNRSHIARHNPARVLAECEAKRRIVEMFYDERGMRGELLDTILRALATPYSDHPDYRQEWTP